MPLFLNNEDVDQLLTMKDTMVALETLYRELGDALHVDQRRRLHLRSIASSRGLPGYGRCGRGGRHRRLRIHRQCASSA